MNDCLFCKIARKEIPAAAVYEDEDLFAFLDINPINPGHVLLIPKEHHENLMELPDALLGKIGPMLKKLTEAVRSATSADGINLGMNNGAAAGQEVFHAHFHVMPRFENDNYAMWHGRPYEDPDMMSVIAKKISENM